MEGTDTPLLYGPWCHFLSSFVSPFIGLLRPWDLSRIEMNDSLTRLGGCFIRAGVWAREQPWRLTDAEGVDAQS